jgi:hypothetical protein
MSDITDEPGFRALVRAAEKSDPPLSRKLLADLYRIQRTFQYADDRNHPRDQMTKRIQEEVDSQTGSSDANP